MGTAQAPMTEGIGVGKCQSREEVRMVSATGVWRVLEMDHPDRDVVA